MNNRFIFILVVVLVIVSVSWFFFDKILSSRPVACTTEAMLCPDGTAVGRTGPNCSFAPCPAVQASASSSWVTYTNKTYGFSLKYPASWSLNDSAMTNSFGSTSTLPSLEIGNPLSGPQVYTVIISVLSNPQNLSSSAFVANMLMADQKLDIQAEQQNEPPENTPEFKSQYPVMVGSYPGYELDGVFAYDESDEEIFVARNTTVIKFDFPVSSMNSNIASPASNNVLVHQILNSLQLDFNAWKFCGGIADLPCAAGYRCNLDATYPDAGGHCVQSN